MVAEGKLTPEQAERHPQRSILTRALGVDDDVEPYQLTLDLHEGDRLLLCSDGLTGMLRDDEIQQILEAEPDPQAAAEQLVEVANRAGGDDNITVIVIDVGDRTGTQGRTDSGLQPRGITAPADGQAPAARAGDTGVLSSPVVVAEAPPAEEPVGAFEGRPHRRRRVIAWMVVAVVVVLAAFVAARVYVSHQWYVGESNERVAIFRGIPTSVLGYELSHVETDTGIPAAPAERLQQWQSLKEGITAESLDDARAIVSQIEQDLGVTATGTP
jgi:hypothetical protein